MDREGEAKNFMELNEEESQLINQKHGQIVELSRAGRGRRRSTRCWFGVDPKILDGTTWMPRGPAAQVVWIDQADKKKKEYDCGPPSRSS